jgi:hypothetical protein
MEIQLISAWDQYWPREINFLNQQLISQEELSQKEC